MAHRHRADGATPSSHDDDVMSCQLTGLSKFPKATLQQEGHDDVDAKMLVQLRLAPTTTTTTSSHGSVLDDNVDAMLFFLETRKSGQSLSCQLTR